MSPIVLPTVTIPGVPVADNCLRHLHKNFEGERIFKPEAHYDCDDVLTFRGTTTIIMKPLIAAPCDEAPSPIPDGSVLYARDGRTYVRKDGLALFTGRFEIRSPKDVLLFTGYMELMDRIGTHHDPFGREKCDEENHIEGWLAGKGSRRLSDLLIRALVVAKADQLPEAEHSGLFGFLNGLIIRIGKVG